MPKSNTEDHPTTPTEILALVRLQKSYSDLKRQFQMAEAAVAEAEQTVLERLDRGAPTPDGFDLAIRKVIRRYPAWKEWFIRLVPNGKVEADRILAKTKLTVTRSVLIREVAVRRAA